MHFDPESAKAEFIRKDTEELIRIAFLEPTYVEQAKELAKLELARRGLPKVGNEQIEQVKAQLERDAEATEEYAMEGSLVLHRLTDKVGTFILIVALWGVTPFLPEYLLESGISDWRFWLFAVMWSYFAYQAIGEARLGSRRQLYLIVVGPITLLILSILAIWLVLGGPGNF